MKLSAISGYNNKMAKRLTVLTFLILLLTGALVTIWYKSTHSKIFVAHTKNAAKPPDTIPQHFKDKTPFDILLLGYGGGTHDGPYLTDSVLDVHVDPKAQKIFLLSIPRDLYVNIPTDTTTKTHMKINAAYAIGLDDAMYPNKLPDFAGSDGGGRLAEYMVSQVTGHPVDYFVGIDFSGFVKTIDTLGGVDINVQPAFDDPAYPDEASASANCGHSDEDIKSFTATVSAETDIWAYFSCRYQNVKFDAGPQHMDGQRALIYVRSRHSAQDGTDFGRAKRQRNLLVAVEEKVFSIGFISKVIPFMSSLNDDVRTDLAPSDIQTLIQNAAALSKYQIISMALTDQNYLTDSFSGGGLSILIPKDGQDNYTNIHTWIADAFAGIPEPVSAVVQVANGTKTPGLAQAATNRLADRRIQTIPPTNTNGIQTMYTTVTAYGKNINPSDLAILENEFNVKGVVYETATTSAFNVKIIVGDNYTIPSTTNK